MAQAMINAVNELRNRKYNWDLDPSGLKKNGVIPWERCIHCGSPYLKDMQYCSECLLLRSIVEACQIIRV